MTHPLGADNPLIVAAFRALIRSQGILVLVLLLLSIGAYAWSRRGGTGLEPTARRILRLSFGFLWLLDGVLQAQPAMPAGLPDQVIGPASAAAPSWVAHLISPALDVWQRHPIQASTAAIWIQLAVGLLLIVCDHGRWSQFAALVSVAWSLQVWALGEAFGGVFSPGASWLFGAPGAVLIYAVAGGLIALPERMWQTGRLPKVLYGGTGAALVLAGVVQAWPGRGFWQGSALGSRPAGGLTQMLDQMSQTSQPRALAGLVSGFGNVDAGHGALVNGFAAGLPILMGLAMLALAVRWRTRPALLVLVTAVVTFAAVWILVQDLGFLGGVGTDPNSMPPLIVLVVAAHFARRDLESAPAERPEPRRGRAPVRLPGAVAALAAFGVAIVGAVPLAVAAASPVADPLLTRALNGDASSVNRPAPGFTLVDQNSHLVSLAGLHGKVVAIAFLDPVCNTDCPLIAQSMRIALERLPAASRGNVVLIAVAANPLHHTLAEIKAFDHEQGLDTLPNWEFVNGPLPDLQAIWRAYGISVQPGVGTQMSVHTDVGYIVDAAGVERVIIGNNPGETPASASSLAGALSTQLKSIVG